MTTEELQIELKKAGINKSIEELLAMSEDELFLLLGQLAEAAGVKDENQT
jgi:hypothetical protein